MQTILETVVSASGQKVNYPYTLDLLPLTGLDDGTQTIRDARARLLQSNQILNGLLNAPFGLTMDLRTQLMNIRFHIINGLTLIDSAQRLGYNVQQPALEVDGLFAAIENHKAAVERTRPLWRAWLADMRAQQTAADPPLPATLRNRKAFGAFGAEPTSGSITRPDGTIVPGTTPSTDATENALKLASSTNLTPYLIAGGIAVLILVLK